MFTLLFPAPGELSPFTFLFGVPFNNPNTTEFNDLAQLEKLERYLALLFIEGQKIKDPTQFEVLHSVQVDVEFVIFSKYVFEINAPYLCSRTCVLHNIIFSF